MDQTQQVIKAVNSLIQAGEALAREVQALKQRVKALEIECAMGEPDDEDTGSG
jgi:hypothetical protein